MYDLSNKMSKNNITVLGIHSWHDAGASIIQNGKILAAINEEKIINIKHASDYLIYQPPPTHFGDTTWYVKPVTYPDLQFLLDPENPNIPSNFELLYKSDATRTVVYKIHH